MILTPKRSVILLTCLSVLALVLVPATSAQAQTFSKVFSPDTIGPGSISTLTFTIDNNTGSALTHLAFTDNFPAALTVATPAQASTSCNGRSNGVVSATEGGSSVSLAGGELAAGSSCTVSVNVTASTPGTHTNVSGALSSSAGTAGTASDDLTVAANLPGFSKSFSPSSVVFNGRSTLTFTIDNSANGSAVFNPTFTDNLPPNMVIASPANTVNNCGGSLSAPAGGSTLSLAVSGSFVQIDAGATCTMSVDVIGAAVGFLENLSGELNSFSGSSGKAGDTLTVTADRLALSKTFVDDPVTAGDNVTLEFTLRFLDRSGTATDIAFTDDLDATLGGLTAVSLPSNPCGSGSTLGGTSAISLSGGTLAAGQSCTFSVTLAVPSGAASGSYVNTTSAVSGNNGATPISGDPASDTLFVEAPGIGLTKTFLDNPVGAGGSTTLEFTLTNNAPSSATNIEFTDEIDAIFPNASLPASGFCGGGSSAVITVISGARSLRVTGGELAAGASCTFQVTLDVVQGAQTTISSNTTSEVTATVGGEPVTGDPAGDDLEVIGSVILGKAFTDDPVSPGDSVTLEFTIVHQESAPGAATDITFSDDLDSVVSGLVASGLPQSDVCGAGSEISGTSTLLLTGGNLQPGETCTFGVTLQVPAGAPFGSHGNTTSAAQATVSGVTTESLAAEDDLVIAGLTLSKEFLGDPALPGATVTLRFTIDNTSTQNATSITFADNLSSALSGLAATGGSQNDVCGVGSSISDGSFVVFQGGGLAAGTSCTFDVPVAVPASAEEGVYINQTSSFSADFGGGTVALPNATDSLEVVTNLLLLEKEFTNDPVNPGENVALRFTISNLSATETVTDIAFTDDLDAALSGLASISGAQSGVCGGSSQISGTSLLSFTGGSLAAGGSCTFTVVLAVPAGVSVQSEPVNTTSTITGSVGGVTVDGGSASDTLDLSVLSFSKAFAGAAEAGGTVSLAFTLENLSGDTLTNIEFTDDLSAVLLGLVANGLPAGNVCGSGSVISGSSLLTLDGGNLLPGGSCTITVVLDVPVSATPGDYLNISSELRQGGTTAAPPARATLTVIEVEDSDGDGVLDGIDVCAGTTIPEGVPTERLGVNRFALVDGDGIFDTTAPPGGGNGPGAEFTIEDTRGCSCEQIIDLLDLGKGHEKFGCSLGAMRDWVSLVSLLSRSSIPGHPAADGSF